jgi:aryl-alcohol dehydrogenase-like predicted oxidoreductase
MQFQQLGPVGLFVSRLAFGTATFGGAHHPLYGLLGGVTQEEADRMIGVALDAGINLFDNADIYAEGEGEVMLGRALGTRRRDAVIATKISNRVGPGPNQVGQSRVHLMNAIENCLRRLSTDRIDLLQLHTFDPLTRFEDCLRTLDDAISHGKVRYIGCSNFSAWQVMKAQAIATALGREAFVSVEAYYSVAGRDIERELVPFVQDQKLALLTWAPFAGGLLTGKFARDRKPDDNSRRLRFEFPPVDLPRAYDVIDVLAAVAARHGATVAQVALTWQLHQPFVTSVVFGVRRLQQLEDNLKSADLVLSEQDLAEIDAVSRLRPEYPRWQQDLPLGRFPGQGRNWTSTIKKD